MKKHFTGCLSDFVHGHNHIPDFSKKAQFKNIILRLRHRPIKNVFGSRIWPFVNELKRGHKI